MKPWITFAGMTLSAIAGAFGAILAGAAVWGLMTSPIMRRIDAVDEARAAGDSLITARLEAIRQDNVIIINALALRARDNSHH